MISEQRLAAIKKQALKSIGAMASNKHAPGVSMVAVTPHEALALVKGNEITNEKVEAAARFYCTRTTTEFDELGEIGKETLLADMRSILEVAQESVND